MTPEDGPGKITTISLRPEPFWDSLVEEKKSITEHVLGQSEAWLASFFTEGYLSPQIDIGRHLANDRIFEIQEINSKDCTFVATANALILLDGPEMNTQLSD